MTFDIMFHYHPGKTVSKSLSLDASWLQGLALICRRQRDGMVLGRISENTYIPRFHVLRNCIYAIFYTYMYIYIYIHTYMCSAVYCCTLLHLCVYIYMYEYMYMSYIHKYIAICYVDQNAQDRHFSWIGMHISRFYTPSTSNRMKRAPDFSLQRISCA